LKHGELVANNEDGILIQAPVKDVRKRKLVPESANTSTKKMASDSDDNASLEEASLLQPGELVANKQDRILTQAPVKVARKRILE